MSSGEDKLVSRRVGVMQAEVVPWAEGGKIWQMKNSNWRQCCIPERRLGRGKERERGREKGRKRGRQKERKEDREGEITRRESGREEERQREREFVYLCYRFSRL